MSSQPSSKTILTKPLTEKPLTDSKLSSLSPSSLMSTAPAVSFSPSHVAKGSYSSLHETSKTYPPVVLDSSQSDLFEAFTLLNSLKKTCNLFQVEYDRTPKTADYHYSRALHLFNQIHTLDEVVDIDLPVDELMSINMILYVSIYMDVRYYQELCGGYEEVRALSRFLDYELKTVKKPSGGNSNGYAWTFTWYNKPIYKLLSMEHGIGPDSPVGIRLMDQDLGRQGLVCVYLSEFKSRVKTLMRKIRRIIGEFGARLAGLGFVTQKLLFISEVLYGYEDQVKIAFEAKWLPYYPTDRTKPPSTSL